MMNSATSTESNTTSTGSVSSKEAKKIPLVLLIEDTIGLLGYDDTLEKDLSYAFFRYKVLNFVMSHHHDDAFFSSMMVEPKKGEQFRVDPVQSLYLRTLFSRQSASPAECTPAQLFELVYARTRWGISAQLAKKLIVQPVGGSSSMGEQDLTRMMAAMMCQQMTVGRSDSLVMLSQLNDLQKEVYQGVVKRETKSVCLRKIVWLTAAIQK